MKQWNRGQLLVFFVAVLLFEGLLAWKYYDLEAQWESSSQQLDAAMQATLSEVTAGVPVTQRVISQPDVYRWQRLILFVGGIVLPVGALAVAWVWFSGKPRTG